MARTETRAPDSSRRARETQRRLIRSSGSARAHIALTVGLGFAATALIIAQATLLAIVIAGVFMDGKSPGEVWGLLVWLAVVALLRGVVSVGFESSGRFGAARVMSELRGRLAERVLLVNPGTTRDDHSGELVASAVDGVEALEAYFARYLPQVVLAATVPIAILIWVFPYDWKAALILAITAPLIPIFMVLIGLLTEGRTRARWAMLSRLSSHFLDLVGGLQTLRAFGRADSQAESIAVVGERYRKETMGALRIGFLSALVLELLAMIGVAMVATAVGIQLASGNLELEAGLVILLLAPELYMPLRQLGNQFHASADGMVAAETIFEVLDRPAAVEPPLDPLPAPSPGAAGLVIEGLSLGFAGRGEVLDGLDLTIEPGETVGLVGPSGGGKTTLISVILKLARPGAGRISCDGVDLERIDPREWRRQIVWVPQRPTLFAGSLDFNLRLFEPGADDHEVRAAVSAAGLEEVVAGLPEGLETRVGDGGRRLSVGQAQRVAVARALLSRAPMVVLDEPTAHLDGVSEAVIGSAIETLAADRTALLVSHRMRAIAGADRVLELRGGRLSPFEPDRPEVAA
jgi:ATP-binding cassette subfamily C protein CydCD